MNQILLGMSFPLSLFFIIYLARNCRAPFWMLVWGPFFMCISALWAIAPDLPRLWGNHRLYSRLATDPRCNIFFWHYTIDITEIDSPWFTAVFMIFLTALLFIAWRELYITEKS